MTEPNLRRGNRRYRATIVSFNCSSLNSTCTQFILLAHTIRWLHRRPALCMLSAGNAYAEEVSTRGCMRFHAVCSDFELNSRQVCAATKAGDTAGR